MIRWLVFVAAGVPLTVLFSALAVAGGLAGAPHGFFDWAHRAWSRSLLALAGVRLEVEGLEHLSRDEPQVIVSNHQSLLDIPALLAGLPVSLRFVAKMELSRIPLFAQAMRRCGHVFIDRTRRTQAVEALREAGRRIQEEGLTLGLFPEGTRSPSGDLGRFRRGSFVLAIETQTTLVPVAVHGGPEVLPAEGRRVVPGTLRVRCGEPVELEGMGRDDRDRLLRRTREAIAGMLGELEADGGGEVGTAEAVDAGHGAGGRGRRPGPAACGGPGARAVSGG